MVRRIPTVWCALLSRYMEYINCVDAVQRNGRFKFQRRIDIDNSLQKRL